MIQPASFNKDINIVQCNQHVATSAAAAMDVNLGMSFSSTDSYEVYVSTAVATTNGGYVPDLVGVLKVSEAKFTVKTSDGSALPAYISWVAVGY